ncbi:MAG: hypothetical protein JWO45_2096, partial [Spartobacteria bacterium]|nr:hypothetical protein [Spartobacteria bacterium]
MNWESSRITVPSSGIETSEDLWGRHFYRWALLACAILSLLHLIALPFVVSWDGYIYIDLADMLGHARAAADWDYLRPPLFPLLMKLIFKLTGRQALSVIMLNTSLGFFGSWLMGSTLKRLGHPVAAGCALLLITLFPLLVAYEHSMLSETGTFFFLALLTYLLVRDGGVRQRRKCAALILALIAGYYYRPTILYLSPVVAAIYGLSLYRERKALLVGRLSRFWIMLAAISIVPFIGAYPWSSLPQVKQRMGGQFYYGASKQALLPPGDPALGSLKDYYDDSVHIALQSNHINVSGLVGGREYALFAQMSEAFAKQSGGSAFLGMIRKSPRRYATGVMRSALLFCGYPGLESDNRCFTTLVLDNDTGAKFLGGPAHLQAGVQATFAQKTAPSSLIGKLYKALVPFYLQFVFLAWPLTFVAFAVGLWRLNWKILALTAIPTAFLVMHALVLMSVDRLVMPAYPLILANLVLIPAWLSARFPRAQRQAEAQPALSNASSEDAVWVAKAERYGWRGFLAILAVLAASHILYLALSRTTPTNDEAHYMGGSIDIINGLKTDGLAGAWNGYLHALGF